MHTLECMEMQTEVESLRHQWRKKWRRYCKKCSGQGQFISYYDPSPPGVSLASGYMTDVEPCKCTNEGICPRCGAFALYSNPDEDEIQYNPCGECGWNWGDGKDDIMPPPYECYCWESEMEAYYGYTH